MVVVTGASRGIGAATARLLSARGAHVVCAARTVNDGDHPRAGSLAHTVGEIANAGGSALAVPVSLDGEDGCHELVARTRAAFGRIDALVNNAAVGFFGPLLELSPSRWNLSLRLNCTAPFVLSQLVLPEMIARGEGRILNITSESAVGPGRGPYPADQPRVGDVAYGAQKALVERLTQGLAQEVYAHGVGVAALAPSQIVPTPGAVLNRHVTGEEDPRAEPDSHMARAVALLLTQPLDEVAGRVVYSQQLLVEAGYLEEGYGRGVDPDMPVSGFSRA